MEGVGSGEELDGRKEAAGVHTEINRRPPASGEGKSRRHFQERSDPFEQRWLARAPQRRCCVLRATMRCFGTARSVKAGAAERFEGVSEDSGGIGGARKER